MIGFKGFFLAFTAISLAEVMLFVAIGERIGPLWTVISVLVTATTGVSIMRYQGFLTLGRIQQQMNQGQMPGKELVEGAFLMVSGALLLTPGFLTDAIGFAFLVPSIRSPLAAGLLKQGMFQVLKGGQAAYYSSANQPAGAYSPPGQGHAPPEPGRTSPEQNHTSHGSSAQKPPGEIIEGEYESKDD